MGVGLLKLLSLFIADFRSIFNTCFKIINMNNFEYKEPSARSKSDMEVAKGFIAHLVKPCEMAPGINIREIWLREAKTALKTMTDPAAIQILGDSIKMWEKFVQDEKE